MRILLEHQTCYQYERPVFLTTHYLRLKPAPHYRIPIESYALSVEPHNHILHWQQDPFNNYLARVDFMASTQSLVVDVKVTINMVTINPFDFYVDEEAQFFPFSYNDEIKSALSPYLKTTKQDPLVREWLGNIAHSSQDIVTFLAMLNQRVSREIVYNIRMEPGIQTPIESLQLRSGSCRDSAWLLVQCLRQLGLAARFASGYLIELDKRLNSLDNSKEDAVALHAWAEVFIPGAGWIGMDTTSGLFTAEGHVPLACTPSPNLATPITGTAEICKTNFTYQSQVSRLESGNGEI